MCNGQDYGRGGDLRCIGGVESNDTRLIRENINTMTNKRLIIKTVILSAVLSCCMIAVGVSANQKDSTETGKPIAQTEQNVPKTKVVKQKTEVEKPKTEVKELNKKEVKEVKNERGTEDKQPDGRGILTSYYIGNGNNGEDGSNTGFIPDETVYAGDEVPDESFAGDSEPVEEPESDDGAVADNNTEQENVVEEPTPEPTEEPVGEDTDVPTSEPVAEEPVVEEPSMEYLGDWTITFYCPAECCCGQWAWGATASGVMPTAWHTVAADLPFGTQLYVDGLGYFVVEDRGVSGAWLDVFVNTHDEALANGMQCRSVYLVG